ncbi:MAG TPA: ATP-binding cassette domain-containing protein, partial [Lutibacter sp.]|nr:ATP-binding cassette domain-containing protein [Lutibacter sp.]
MEPILKVQNLSISFGSDEEQNKVVNAVSFELNPQQILGIVGESGSGKSVTSLAILGLLPKNATITGSIL